MSGDFFPIKKMKVSTEYNAKDIVEKLSGQFSVALNPQYSFVFDETEESLNLETEKNISLNFSGELNCPVCGRSVKKFYNGSCYVCFKNKASQDMCVLSPHKCHYFEGTCREQEWGENFCFTPHYVYLSYTDKLKVGITRESQLPTRWVDQGATAGAVIAKVWSRQQAGKIEKELGQLFSDKSHWKRMLNSGNEKPTIEFMQENVKKAQDFLWGEGHNLLNEDLITQFSTQKTPEQSNPVEKIENPTVFFIQYPIVEIPKKFTSTNFEKQEQIEGKLMGIKGQYLYIDDKVINIRRHEGYNVSASLA